MAKASAARIELGRSFHQEETFNLKVCESDFVPLWHSFEEHKLPEAHKFEVMHLGKGVHSQWWFYRLTSMP